MGDIVQLRLIRDCINSELYEECVEWSCFSGPLRCHEPEWSVQCMLIEYARDNGTHIFFMQLLSADIHNFGLSTNESDQWALSVKACNLDKIVQSVAV